MADILPQILPHIDKHYMEYLTQYGKLPTFLVVSNVPLRMMMASLKEVSDYFKVATQSHRPLRYKGMLVVYLQRDEWVVEVG